MRLVIACAQKWFELDQDIINHNRLLFVKDETELTFQRLNQFKPDFIFFPHWNWIVQQEIFENFKCIVFHTAPLPYGRGGSPIQNLILDKFSEAPVCALKMTSDLDAGPVYAKQTVSLAGSLSQIFERINVVINSLIVQIIKELPDPVPQVGRVHRYKRRTEQDNQIPAGIEIDEVYDRIRMLDDTSYPNAFLTVGDLKIKLFSASIDDGSVIAMCKIKKC